MNACIVEIRKNHAAALMDDGSVIKIRNQHYSVGQVIKIKRIRLPMTAKIAGIAAAAVAVLAFFSVGAWAYFTPYTYVSLDVNPSIEYSVNRFDRVLSAKAVNNDGAQILNSLSLNNETITDAVSQTVNKIESDGYFNSSDPGGIVISTSSDDTQAASQLADELKTTAEDAVKTSGSTVPVEAISIGRSRVLEAQKLGTTPGKLNLIQKLQASVPAGSSINVQEWLKRPVKDIMKAIKANRKGSAVSSGTDGGTTVSQPETRTGSSDESASEVAVSALPKAPTGKQGSGWVRKHIPEKQMPSISQPSASSPSSQTIKSSSKAAKAVGNTSQPSHSGTSSSTNSSSVSSVPLGNQNKNSTAGSTVKPDNRSQTASDNKPASTPKKEQENKSGTQGNSGKGHK